MTEILMSHTGLDPRGASVLLALGIGAVFGLAAERSQFCFRRAILTRGAALSAVLVALAVAVMGTQLAVAAGWLDFAGHRFHAPRIPVLAVVVGGAVFGAGMVLTRGCTSRLTVLAATGNLRAGMVLLVFAVTAHAMMKGLLAPLRDMLSTVTVRLGPEAAHGLSLPPLAWGGLLVGVATVSVWRWHAERASLLWAGVIGGLVVLGWLGTGVLLMDAFDPIPLESLSIAAPMADGLFWTITASAVRPSFGPGLIGGILLGALISSLWGRRFRWQGFHGPAETGRYLTGGVLMGCGAVLAGGCTLGAGLTGLSTLSVSAGLAVCGIVAGALAMQAGLNASPFGCFGSSARQSARPAM